PIAHNQYATSLSGGIAHAHTEVTANKCARGEAFKAVEKPGVTDLLGPLEMPGFCPVNRITKQDARVIISVHDPKAGLIIYVTTRRNGNQFCRKIASRPDLL